MPKTVAEHTVEQLAAWGVEYVFGVAGDTIIPLLEALRRQDQVRYIGVRHEEAAGFMASAYAKLTGRLGACVAEAGPAAVHLLAGVYDAHLDRVPVLALTGESATRHLGTDWPQTIDQDLIYKDATCFNHTLATAEQVDGVLFEALRRAEVEADVSRLGLPVDLQLKVTGGSVRPRPDFLQARVVPDEKAVDRAARLLGQARRPLLFVGQGARGAARLVVDLADRLGAAIIHTMPAKDVVPADHPRNLGVIGPFGTDAAAEAFAQADVVLVIGSTWSPVEYAPAARFIQVDRSPRRLGMGFPAEIGLAGEAGDVLGRLLKAVRSVDRRDWTSQVEGLKRRQEGDGVVASRSPLENGRAGVAPQELVATLQQRLDRDAVLCLDVGDNTFWVSALFRAEEHRLLISGHWRSMGFGLPAAVAAQLAAPDRQVVAVAGDGGFAMTMAEFTTAVALELHITVVVLNNGVLGEEGHRQARMKLEPYGVRLHNPDFAAYARACGGEGYAVETTRELDRALKEALSSRRPCIVDVATQAVMPAWPTPRGTLRPGRPSPAEQAEPLRV